MNSLPSVSQLFRQQRLRFVTRPSLLGYGTTTKPPNREDNLLETKHEFNSTYDINDVKVNIDVVRRNKSDRFSATDTVFNVRFTNTENSNPTLFSVGLLIFRALREIVERVKEYYKNECEDRFVSLSIKSENMTNDIHLGFRNLNTDSDIADQCMKTVVHYLMSNMSLKLSSGLVITIVVVGTKHNEEIHKQKKTALKIGGSMKNLKNFNLLKSCRKRSLFPITPGYIGHPKCFENRCLIVALAIGMFFNTTHKKTKNGGPAWRKIQRFHGSVECRIRAAGKKILELTRDMCNASGVSFDGPHSFEETIPILNHYNIQLQVFSKNEGNRIIYRYPEEFKRDRQPITLYHVVGFDDVNHVHLVKNVKGYFGIRGWPCQVCTKPISSVFAHRCSLAKTCKKCGRIQKHHDSYSSVAYDNMYCDSLLNNESRFCDDCNNSFKSESCFKNHRKYTCKNNWICPRCQIIYRRRGMKYAEFKKIANTHKCNQDFCRICFLTIEHDELESHICDLKTPTFQSVYSKIAVFDIESIVGHNGHHCANVLVCQYETNYGVWNEIVFVDKQMSWKGQKFKRQIAVDNYLPEDVRDMATKEFVRTRYGHKRTKKKSEFPAKRARRQRKADFADNSAEENSDSNDSCSESELENKTNGGNLEETLIHEREDELDLDAALDTRTKPDWLPTKNTTKQDSNNDSCILDFLHFFMRKEFQGMTFLSHNGGKFDTNFILCHLLRLGFMPNSLLNGASIMSLTIEEFDIRFVDSRNWLQGSLSALSERFPTIEAKKGVFPIKFNCLTSFNYGGPVPDFEFFKTENDTDKTLQEKQEFHQKLETQNYVYDFNNEIVNYCRDDCNVLRQALTAFLKQSFDFQKILVEQYGSHKQSEKLPYLSPLSLPHITLSSYAFNSFKGFAVDLTEQFCVMDEQGKSKTITSEGEMQWVTFMEKKYPNILHGYNTEKQVKFDRMVPDGYCPVTKTVFYYHGCVEHGHLPQKLKLNTVCPHMCKSDTANSKNFRKKTFGDLERDFDRKINLLKTKFVNDVKHVELIYQCEWEALLKNPTSEEFEFYNGEFNHRPKKRMIIRDFLRGGRTEMFEVSYDNDNTEDFYYKDVNAL
jgi:hypothetical protein